MDNDPNTMRDAMFGRMNAAKAAPTLDTSTLGPIRLTQPQNFDPGSPKYEAARALLVADLKRLEMHDLAAHLKQGELYEVQTWIAMQIIARLL